MKLRLVGTIVLVLGIAALLSASAYAGNGNGNGNGHGNGKDDQPAPAAAQAEHGNATAPGQLKTDEAPATGTTSVEGAPAAPTAAPANGAGVKPGNDTAHETHAPAASAETKLYGNGKTAGQIAIGNGAAPSTSIHGPGNSQPHKVSPCAGGHEVDVHAAKGKRARGCGDSSPPPHPTPDPVKVPDPAKSPEPAKSHDPAKGSPASSPVVDPRGTVVVGVEKPKVSPGRHAGAAAGILGAAGRVGRGTLPFTGLDLWSTVFVAVALILIGLAMCLRVRTLPVPESEEGAHS